MSKLSRYENVKVTITGQTLTLTVNLDEHEVDVQPSKSGKTYVIATTGGGQRVAGSPVKVNLTVYRPQVIP